VDEREKKTEGEHANPWFTRGSYWVGEGGKKAGKQVIRSRGLSIEVGVGGTWRECTTPYQYPSFSSSRPPLFRLYSRVFSRRMRLLPGTTAVLVLLPMLLRRCYCCCCCCYHHHDSNSWLASSDIDRYFQFLFYVLSVDSCCAFVPVSTRPFVWYLTWFFNLVLYCYLVFLSVCSFLPMGLLSREKKNEIIEALANRTLMWLDRFLFFLNLILCVKSKICRPSIYLHRSCRCNCSL